MAGVTGTFAVNGSPTRTQLADRSGGRTQLAQLATVVVVGLVLVLLTHPLQYLPVAVLASVVFLIGVELVDLKGLHRILTHADRRVRGGHPDRPDRGRARGRAGDRAGRGGLDRGPPAAQLPAGGGLSWSRPPIIRGGTGSRPTPGARTVPGLVIYRFASSIYYANAHHLVVGDHRLRPARPHGPAPMVVPGRRDDRRHRRHRRPDPAGHPRPPWPNGGSASSSPSPSTRSESQLARYGIIDLVGADAVFPTVRSALKAFESASPP